MRDITDTIVDAVWETLKEHGVLECVVPDSLPTLKADCQVAAITEWNRESKNTLVDVAKTLAKHDLGLMQQGVITPGAGYRQPQGMPQYIIFGGDKDLVFFTHLDLWSYVQRTYGNP